MNSSNDSLKPFKPPRKLEKVIDIDDLSTSSTEEFDAIMDQDCEDFIIKEIQDWLAMHGTKLFALETSKFLAAEAKAQNRKNVLRTR